MARICKVLVVEDDLDVQQLLQTVFVDEGYHLIIASDGASTRRILDADKTIDAVVLDLGLPKGPDGFTLATEAAEQGLGVVIVTGDYRYHERLDASGHRYLLKPYSTSALVQAVKDEIAGSRRDRGRVRAAAP